jgi:hypothetical protein
MSISFEATKYDDLLRFVLLCVASKLIHMNYKSIYNYWFTGGSTFLSIYSSFRSKNNVAARKPLSLKIINYSLLAITTNLTALIQSTLMIISIEVESVVIANTK